MPPKIRLKGPKILNGKVSISSEFSSENDYEYRQKLIVTIKIDFKKLDGVAPSSEKNRSMDEDAYKNKYLNQRIEKGRNRENEEREPTDEIEDISDSDLSSLDFEINRALSNNHPSKEDIKNKENKTDIKPEVATNDTEQMQHINLKTESGAQEDSRQEDSRHNVKSETTKGTTIYKPIPSNILPLLKKELGSVSLEDEEFTTVEKMIFSLRDPLSACKIRLPVKSNYCPHFECFDFETFCIFNNIPPGIQHFTKKELVKRRMTKLTLKDKQPTISSPITIIDNDENRVIPNKKKKVQPRPPTYSCPLCDTKFPLSELNISDSFNYFIKSSSKDTTKIELWDMVKYRIIDKEFSVKAQDKRNSEIEITVLSDDDDSIDEQHERNRTNDGVMKDKVSFKEADADTTGESETQGRFSNSPLMFNDNIFEDGLDEELVKLSEGNISVDQKYEGAGSWEDPLILD